MMSPRRNELELSSRLADYADRRSYLPSVVWVPSGPRSSRSLTWIKPETDENTNLSPSLLSSRYHDEQSTDNLTTTTNVNTVTDPELEPGESRESPSSEQLSAEEQVNNGVNRYQILANIFAQHARVYRDDNGRKRQKPQYGVYTRKTEMYGRRQDRSCSPNGELMSHGNLFLPVSYNDHRTVGGRNGRRDRDHNSGEQSSPESPLFFPEPTTSSTRSRRRDKSDPPTMATNSPSPSPRASEAPEPTAQCICPIGLTCPRRDDNQLDCRTLVLEWRQWQDGLDPNLFAR